MTFKQAWDHLEKKIPHPTKAKEVKILDYSDFKKDVLSDDPEFIKK